MLRWHLSWVLGTRKHCFNRWRWEGHSRQREQQSKGREWECHGGHLGAAGRDEWEMELERWGGILEGPACLIVWRFFSSEHEASEIYGQGV